MFRSVYLSALIIGLGLVAIPAAIAQPPTIGDCPVLPSDNIWNTPVDQLSVSSNSANWVTTIGSTKTLHPDFGSGLYNGAPMGIPFVTVPGTQTKYPTTFTYADESDPGPYAIPLNAPIEGSSQSTGDRHTIAIDTDNCILYELYAAYPQSASWSAGSGAIFNLLSDALRPSGWTSTDAAGLPIFPGLVRYDEIAAGTIRHAIRFTVPQTQAAFVWPARHYASTLTGSQYPPMGARFRLRADFDITGYSATNQIILTALKKYGMMVADNGSSWYISGATDSRWNNDDLHNLGQIQGSDFEAVDASSLMVNPNSGQAAPPTTVSVSVTPSTAIVPVNASQQFSATVANAGSQVVSWSVNNSPGGSSTVGWISSNGLYTAPAVPPPGGSITVQAASSVTTSAVGTAVVTVTSPAPVLSSMVPNSGIQGASVAVTLNGSNFEAGATVATGGSGVTASNIKVVSATQITATFNVDAAAATGACSVTVSTAAGATSPQSFTVTAPAKPVLTSLTPNSSRRGATVTLSIKGTNFSAPVTARVQGSAITVSNVVVASTTSITATLHIGQNAARGPHNISVATNAGKSNALPFTVQ